MAEMLLFTVVGIVIGSIGLAIRTARRSAAARNLLRQAEAAAASGDWAAADTHYRQLIVAVAGNKDEVPRWLARLEEAGRQAGRPVDSAGVLAAQQAIVDIWASRMSDGEKRKLHGRAVEGLKGCLGLKTPEA